MNYLSLLRPAKRKLNEVLVHLPSLGIGARVTRTSWCPYGNSYWEITKVKASQDGQVGKAWGYKVWKGVKSGKPMEIKGRAKKIWCWMPHVEEAKRLEPLLRHFQPQSQTHIASR